ncbi:MAG: serine hydrolase domain-containing protein [Congregibacter sp.]
MIYLRDICLALLLTVCTTLGWSFAARADAGETSVETAAEKAADGEKIRLAQWNRFATAMARHSPLGRVMGDPGKTLCEASAEDMPGSERYKNAIEYAREMDSYSLIIWRNGKCELAQYFAPYPATLRPESASMHKSVVGLLIAAAIGDGFIDSIDDPVGQYISEWKYDPRGEITLRDVATMSSGLETLSMLGGMTSPAMSYLLGKVDARQTILDRPLKDAPGSVFHYSGLNTQLLLLVIESATGEPYLDYLSRRLWQPIGARDAYTWNFPGLTSTPRANTALMASAEDWLRVGLLIKDLGVFGGEQIIPSGHVEAMSVPSEANPNYGWQIWMGNRYQEKRYYNEQQLGAAVPMREPFINADMIYFDGFGGQRVYISRNEDLVIVRQGDMRIDWDDSALPNSVLRVNAAEDVMENSQ